MAQMAAMAVLHRIARLWRREAGTAIRSRRSARPARASRSDASAVLRPASQPRRAASQLVPDDEPRDRGTWLPVLRRWRTWLGHRPLQAWSGRLGWLARWRPRAARTSIDPTLP